MQGAGDGEIDMEGSSRGLIPRAFQSVFEACSTLTDDYNWKWTYDVQVLEIYNETVRDLLVSNTSNEGSTDEQQKLELRFSSDMEDVEVVGSNVVPVSSCEEVISILTQASTVRASGSTNINTRSSRSHCVFILRINGTHPIHKVCMICVYQSSHVTCVYCYRLVVVY